MIEIKIIKNNQEQFSKEVIDFAEDYGLRYLDSLIEISNKWNLEVEIVPKLMTKDLKNLLEQESKQFRLLVKEITIVANTL